MDLKSPIFTERGRAKTSSAKKPKATRPNPSRRKPARKNELKNKRLSSGNKRARFARRASREMARPESFLFYSFPWSREIRRVLGSRARQRARLYQDKHTPNCHPRQFLSGYLCFKGGVNQGENGCSDCSRRFYVFLPHVLHSAPDRRVINVHKARDLYELHTCHISVQSIEFFRFEVHFLDQGVNGGSIVFRRVKGDDRLCREFIVQAYRPVVMTGVLFVEVPVNMMVASAFDGDGLTVLIDDGISEFLPDMVAKEADRSRSDIVSFRVVVFGIGTPAHIPKQTVVEPIEIVVAVGRSVPDHDQGKDFSDLLNVFSYDHCTFIHEILFFVFHFLFLRIRYFRLSTKPGVARGKAKCGLLFVALPEVHGDEKVLRK